MIKKRAVFINDLWDQANFFFERPVSYDAEIIKKRWNEDTPDIINSLVSKVSSIATFTPENTEKELKAWIQQEELGMGQVMNIFRLLIVGEGRGPHLFDIISWLGKEETLDRINRGLRLIKP